MTVDSAHARRVLEGLLGIPATEGNRVERLRNGDEIFPAMLAAIDGAQRTIDFTTFVYWTGDIARRVSAALCAKAREGVRVRVVLDAFGARDMDGGLLEAMVDAGIQHLWFRPAKHALTDPSDIGHRTHRKVLVVDEEVAFTGGVGIAAEWEGDARDPSQWRDSHFRVRGPAVDGLRAAFVDDWIEADDVRLLDDHDRFPDQAAVGDQVAQVVRGEAEHGRSDIALLKHALLSIAEDRVRLTSAYFSPEPAFAARLCETARRGVRVEVLMPGEHTDKRLPQVVGEVAYEQLLDAGVRIHRYERTMLHAKVLTVDGVLSNVGSANANSRSFRHDAEIDLVVFDPALTATLDADFDDDLRSAVAVEHGEWERRGPLQRLQEGAAGVIEGMV